MKLLRSHEFHGLHITGTVFLNGYSFLAATGTPRYTLALSYVGAVALAVCEGVARHLQERMMRVARRRGFGADGAEPPLPLSSATAGEDLLRLVKLYIRDKCSLIFFIPRQALTRSPTSSNW